MLNLGKKGYLFGKKKIYPYATGGDYVYLYEEGNKTYRVHEFLTTGTSTLEVEVGGQMEYLIVGGGGGGGYNRAVVANYSAAGGGGGGATFGTINPSENDSLTITVGSGGTAGTSASGVGDNGGNSSFNGVTTFGGGGGGGFNNTSSFWVSGKNGGAGGGGVSTGRGLGTTGQGKEGGLWLNPGGGAHFGGGGGGAAEAGEQTTGTNPYVAGAGGAGVEWPQGSGKYYGGGGGAGGWTSETTPAGGGTGGVGGGGDGGAASGTKSGNGKPGENGTGGGGGGGGRSNYQGGNGGSGIVIVRYVVAEKTLWTPSESTSLVAWWKADSLTNLSDSDSVSSWNDESGNGYNVSPGQSGTGPIYKENIINNLPVIRFTDGGKNLERTDSGITIARNASGLITSSVVNLRTAATQRKDVVGVVSGVNTNNYLAAIDFHRTANKHCSLIRRGGNDSPTIAVSSANYSAGNWYIRSTIHDWSTGNLYQYVDGSLDPTSPAAHGGSTNTEDTDNSAIKIGGFLSSAVGAFDIGEIVILKDTVDTVDLQKLEGYLAHKWGLTNKLPSGHPYKYEPPYKVEPEEIVTDGLVLNLDAGDYASYPRSGTTWYDTSGYARNATINGNPSFIQNPNCFDITSDSTYISLSNSGLVPRTNPFTYSTWIKFDSFDTLDTIFENGSWQDTLLLRHQTNTVNVYAEAGYRGTFSWPTKNTGQWYNIVFLRESGGTCRMYVNNVLTGSPFNMTTDIDLANTNLFLMRSQFTTNQFTNGKIATFSVYNRALSGIEIEQNFTALRGRYGV